MAYLLRDPEWLDPDYDMAEESEPLTAEGFIDVDFDDFVVVKGEISEWFPEDEQWCEDSYEDYDTGVELDDSEGVCDKVSDMIYKAYRSSFRQDGRYRVVGHATLVYDLESSPGYRYSKKDEFEYSWDESSVEFNRRKSTLDSIEIQYLGA